VNTKGCKAAGSHFPCRSDSKMAQCVSDGAEEATAAPWTSAHPLVILNAILVIAALAAYSLECVLQRAGVGAPPADVDGLFSDEGTTARKGERRARKRYS
jgi:hypothetical protein